MSPDRGEFFADRHVFSRCREGTDAPFILQLDSCAFGSPKAGELQVDTQVDTVAHESTRKQTVEDQAKIDAIEAEKRAQEEEVLLQEAEVQRRKDAFEQIRQFAEEEPDTTTDILRNWVTEAGADTEATESDSTKEEA